MKDILCSVCGFAIQKQTRIHSKFTGNSYCLDLDECYRRARNDLTYAEIVELATRTAIQLEKGLG